jgi:23S rRNA (pseudouridine1915-N3)-methyltransferase
MQITIAAVGTRLDPWIYEAFETYHARLPRHLKVSVEEVPLARRVASTRPGAAIAAEGEKLLKHVRPGALAIVLDEHGHEWSSAELAVEVGGWLRENREVAILIGGPDGLSAACHSRADRLWSLSRLTFPHALVRVLLVEQLYRACTILQGHPYHRP